MSNRVGDSRMISRWVRTFKNGQARKTNYRDYFTEFCSQCSKRIFGVDFLDLRSCADWEDSFGDTLAYCYGCGWTLIDREGVCLLNHHEECEAMSPDDVLVESGNGESGQTYDGPPHEEA